jgi:hypothetical protein
MNAIQVKLPTAPARWKILARIAVVLAAMTLIGAVMHQCSTALDRRGTPAGFVRGIVQGALMPCALPNLLVGNDVTIYAQNNTGRTYKLGYTCGVNACGAVFFGMFFWRLNRWRRRMNGTM